MGDAASDSAEALGIVSQWFFATNEKQEFIGQLLLPILTGW